ncbi:hypothetical protein [Candidatus Thiodictyon syntrophicum]|uniref:hypothetical protein n=1 Tax=Candidatus Thiodictyon syntrophicum TaxID=1166950 RepID=UPI0012FDD802|nr:hypothetical protein [Candidatus Thiodictyon syntrophicum]
MNTLVKLQQLESLYRQGYQSEVVDRTLEKMIALENAQTRRELEIIEADLQVYERQYQMTSRDFQERFHDGELGDGADYFEWSALCDMAQILRERLHALQSER